MAAIQFNYNSLAASFRGNQPDPPFLPAVHYTPFGIVIFIRHTEPPGGSFSARLNFTENFLNKFESRAIHLFVQFDPYANEAQIIQSGKVQIYLQPKKKIQINLIELKY